MTKGGGPRRPGAAATVQYALRIDPALLARVDRYVEQLQASTPWAGVTRADAMRAVMVAGLDALKVPAVEPGPEPVKSKRSK